MVLYLVYRQPFPTVTELKVKQPMLSSKPPDSWWSNAALSGGFICVIAGLWYFKGLVKIRTITKKQLAN